MYIMTPSEHILLNMSTYSMSMMTPSEHILHDSTYSMYMMTPNDHISHDLSYFSGPRTSGAEIKETIN